MVHAGKREEEEENSQSKLPSTPFPLMCLYVVCMFVFVIFGNTLP